MYSSTNYTNNKYFSEFSPNPDISQSPWVIDNLSCSLARHRWYGHINLFKDVCVNSMFTAKQTWMRWRMPGGRCRMTSVTLTLTCTPSWNGRNIVSAVALNWSPVRTLPARRCYRPWGPASTTNTLKARSGKGQYAKNVESNSVRILNSVEMSCRGKESSSGHGHESHPESFAANFLIE